MPIHHFSGLPLLDIRLSDTGLQAILEKFLLGLNIVLKNTFSPKLFYSSWLLSF